MERTQVLDLMGELKLYGMLPEPMMKSWPSASSGSMNHPALWVTC